MIESVDEKEICVEFYRCSVPKSHLERHFPQRMHSVEFTEVGFILQSFVHFWQFVHFWESTFMPKMAVLLKNE